MLSIYNSAFFGTDESNKTKVNHCTMLPRAQIPGGAEGTCHPNFCPINYLHVNYIIQNKSLVEANNNFLKVLLMRSAPLNVAAVLSGALT